MSARPRTRDKLQSTPKWTAGYMQAMLHAADLGYAADFLEEQSVEAYVEGDWLASARKLRLAAEELHCQADSLAKAAGILETGYA